MRTHKLSRGVPEFDVYTTDRIRVPPFYNYNIYYYQYNKFVKIKIFRNFINFSISALERSQKSSDYIIIVYAKLEIGKLNIVLHNSPYVGTTGTLGTKES